MTQLSATNMTNNDLRNFSLFITGKAVSVFGAAIYNFAISLYVLNRTGSALSFATNLLMGILPLVLFSPVAGVIVDSFDKKKMIILMDILCGIIFLVLYRLPSLSLLAIYTSTVMLTLCSTLFGIAIESAKPNLVSSKHLVKLNAAGKTIDSLSAILGPILGGMVYAFVSIQSFILFNAVSFLFSAFTECFFVFKALDQPTKATGFTQALKEGIQYFVQSPQIMKLAGVFVFINFFLGFSVQVPMPYIINEVLGLSPRSYGMITSAFPIGMILGALVIEPLMKRLDYRRMLEMALSLMSLSALVMTLPFLFKPSSLNPLAMTALYGSVMGLLGISVAFIDLPLMIMLQETLPDYIRGRIMGLVSSLAKIILPLCLLASGALLEQIPAFLLPLAGGILAFIFLIFFRKS